MIMCYIYITENEQSPSQAESDLLVLCTFHYSHLLRFLLGTLLLPFSYLSLSMNQFPQFSLWTLLTEPILFIQENNPQTERLVSNNIIE